ncbi:hypothetical protein KOR34_37310 [Posidoniimonas corsicana]|uniref:Uncharacterized protein n=1 Tax=Posidoniimonas corsicana TaxID=1938618 RepID=A0A5C5V832_9BACT|nr:hypothetical protein [Posidoniimonas corsicana]TWT33895.1 hypothetical protein KOR34_37310 [Posidoniimonas corsicana]
MSDYPATEGGERLPLFDPPQREPEREEGPLAPCRSPAADRKRLGKQQREIVELLRQGEQPNHRLAQIGIRYSARIEELGKVGYVIKHRKGSSPGENIYWLESEPSP